jgi:nucleotide-binding universal stress UspA family protein
METILCPTDFSPAAENAIRYGYELAQRMSSRLILFHSIPEPADAIFVADKALLSPAGPDPGYLQKQLYKLEAQKENLEKSEWGLPLTYQTQIIYGQAQDTIPQVAHQVQADMIVLGQQQAGGLKSLLAKPVMAEVIKRVSCPVLVIPPKTTFRQVHRIVFATDLAGEPFTEVAFVMKLASLFAAEILFLYVLTSQAPEYRQQAQAELDLLHKRLPYKNVDFYTETNIDIEAGISQFCSRHQADMLVMAYHPGPRWQRLTAQDYTRDMAYHTRLPLLILHYRY